MLENDIYVDVNVFCTHCFKRQYLGNEATTIWISFHFQVYGFKIHLYIQNKNKKAQEGSVRYIWLQNVWENSQRSDGKIPDTEVLKRQNTHTLLKLPQQRCTDHFTQECLISDYQRKSLMENFNLEIAPKVVRRKVIRTTLKPLLRTCHQRPGNRLHMIEQSEVASSERQLRSWTKSVKPEPMDHRQNHAHLQSWLALFAADRAKIFFSFNKP